MVGDMKETRSMVGLHTLSSLMTGMNSSSGISFPTSMYTFIRCFLKSSSKASSFSVLCSSPYHQHQSLPSAMYISCHALVIAALSAVPSLSNSTSALLVSSSRSQAVLSSSWPIQILKLWFIHEPEKSLGRAALGGLPSRYSLMVTDLIRGSLESLP